MYLSDIIEAKNILKGRFNIIHAGTGFGKTYWCSKNAAKTLGIKNSEIIFVTSRTLIVDQQNSMNNDFLKIKSDFDTKYFRQWGENQLNDIDNKKIPIMTYNRFFSIIKNSYNSNGKIFKNIKCIILDECHAMLVDNFIKEMSAINIFVKDNINNFLFIGLTATPEPFEDEDNLEANGFNINYPIEEKLVKNKANELMMVYDNSLSYMITNCFKNGKTIIMCKTISDCRMLQDRIPHSKVLCSKENKGYDKETMDIIRNCIIEYKKLPEDCHVLITTNTSREGIGFIEESNIQNVVLYGCSDIISVMQFMGRLRYNFDRLVICEKNWIPNFKKNIKGFKAKSTNDCKKLFVSNSDSWFASIMHVLNIANIGDIKFPKIPYHIISFTEYINKKWLAPPSQAGFNKAYIIYKKEDRSEILKIACTYRLLGLPKSKMSFNKVIKYMRAGLGYTVDDIKYKTFRGKYVRDHNEDIRNQEINRINNI